MLRSGWGKVEFTPSGSQPLAGYAHLRERRSRRVRDALFARAIAFEQGQVSAAILAFDLLMVTEDLAEALRSRLRDASVFLIVHATHTHSSIGGFVPGLLGRLFAGAYRPSVLERLADAGERAVREALASLAPASLAVTSRTLPGLNGNRRDPNGPTDEELTVFRVARGNDHAIGVSYPAHPVIVAERDHLAVSADFPGEVVRRLEEEAAFSIFVQGSLGGVDVLFPSAPTSVEQNLSMISDPIVHSARHLARIAEPVSGPVAVASEEWEVGPARPDPFFDDQPAARLRRPVAALLGRLVPSSIRSARIQGLRVGPFALIGTPADLGVGLGLAIKRQARASGLAHPIVASQCDGYIGYLHRAEDYRTAPARSHRGMAHYENAMAFFGHESGEAAFEAACRVVNELAAARCATRTPDGQ